ncbi:MAG: MGMT family protein [Caldilineaceae bacterium]|nr:MGMT family protein [Caldilineaceae bacterium]MCB0079790.1 MGMT family protein [Caldilineaceae bacterium]
MEHQPIYQRIYAVVRQIPPGTVATYGQIAAIVGNCTPRMVGYAMAALHGAGDVPWQRVINAQGKISPRADGASTAQQRLLLEEEGIVFRRNGQTDLRVYRWSGPSLAWLLEHGYEPTAEWRED